VPRPLNRFETEPLLYDLSTSFGDIQYNSLADEAIGVAQYVKNLIEQKGYKPGEILVLAQRRTIGNPIHEALAGNGIPSKSYYQEGALDNIAAQERLAMLKLLVDPNVLCLCGTETHRCHIGSTACLPLRNLEAVG
jgi:superfamily I DNA/RNA helicase